MRMLLIVAALLLALPVIAQDDLPSESTVVGQTGTIYNMSGKAGELLTAEAIALTSGLTPRLILTLGTDPNPIAVSESLQPGSTTLTYRLPQNSHYNLKVDGHGTSGQFVLTLNRTPAETSVPLANQTTLLTGTYTFNAPAELHLSGSGWSAEIRDAFGQIVARVSNAPSANMLIAESGTYELAILSGTAALQYHPRPDLAAAFAATPDAVPTDEATPSSKRARSLARRQAMTYGSGVTGSISAAGRTASFPFTGTAGDLVFARVLPVGGGLEADLSIVAPDGSAAVGHADGSVTDRLAISGPYVLVVTAQNGTSGDFVVRLDAQMGSSLPLSLGQLTSAPFVAGEAALVYHFDQTSSAQLLLTLSADDPAFRFSSTIRSHDGQPVAYFNGEMRSVVLTLDSGAGAFDLTLTPNDSAAPGLVLIDLESNAPHALASPTPLSVSATPTLVPASATSRRTPIPGSATPTPAPALATLTPVSVSATPTLLPVSASPTPTLTPVNQAVSGAVYCHVSSNGTANIRSAPNTSASVIERLTRSQSVDVIGLSADGGWYAVRLATRVGWVATTVVRQIDPCVNVPPLSP